MNDEKIKCIFCNFFERGLKKSQSIFEDDKVLTILNDFPISEGHTLAILKKHRDDITTISQKEASHIGNIVVKIAKCIKRALKCEYVYVATLGEKVKHTHFHLVPRYKNQKRGFEHFLLNRDKIEIQKD